MTLSHCTIIKATEVTNIKNRGGKKSFLLIGFPREIKFVSVSYFLYLDKRIRWFAIPQSRTMKPG